MKFDRFLKHYIVTANIWYLNFWCHVLTISRSCFHPSHDISTTAYEFYTKRNLTLLLPPRMLGKVSSQQQPPKHDSSLDELLLEDDVHRHDWLFKDGPFHLGRPIVEYWANNQVLCIKLGDSPLPQMEVGPVEYLQNLIDESIDPSSPFQIIADFESGQWPLEQGYRRLGDYLAFLGKHELDYGSWSNLQIYLPDNPIPYDPPSTPVIPLDALTNLRQLTWYAHRNQLCRSWLPLIPSIYNRYTLSISTVN
ncbi:hypothetical protein H2248_012339 [Termitomyces sp. 'cryptogamus']|nr:hypothetical protein H2248_012339 [Termitomyces sp. 'cryptogamus']